MSLPAPTGGFALRLTRDTLIADRYRLERVCATRGGLVRWQANDEVLHRPVAVRVAPLARDDPREAALRSAVGRASRVSDPRLPRLLDIGFAETADGPYAVVVSEWVHGPTLAELLQSGPLTADLAVRVGAEVGAALLAATTQQAGRHGRLHPGAVHVDADGAVRLTDLEVAAALEGRGYPDVALLGAVLAAMLTGRWPGPAELADGLPVGPLPRRWPRGAGLRVARRLLEDTELRLPAALELLQRLAKRPAADGAGVPVRRPTARRVVAVTAVLALAGVGVLGWRAGVGLGTLPGSGRPGSGRPGAGAAAPVERAPAAGGVAVPLTPVSVRDFDPAGDDGSENPTAVPLAVDGDPTTAWETSTYRGSADFGGLKPGVGLLVDLGRSVAVRAVRVTLTRPGATLQVRSAAAAPTRADEAALRAQSADAPAQLTLTPSAGAPARWWLLWLTRLPSTGQGGYQLGVAELQLFR